MLGSPVRFGGKRSGGASTSTRDRRALLTQVILARRAMARTGGLDSDLQRTVRSRRNEDRTRPRGISPRDGGCPPRLVLGGSQPLKLPWAQPTVQGVGFVSDCRLGRHFYKVGDHILKLMSPLARPSMSRGAPGWTAPNLELNPGYRSAQPQGDLHRRQWKCRLQVALSLHGADMDDYDGDGISIANGR